MNTDDNRFHEDELISEFQSNPTVTPPDDADAEFLYRFNQTYAQMKPTKDDLPMPLNYLPKRKNRSLRMDDLIMTPLSNKWVGLVATFTLIICSVLLVVTLLPALVDRTTTPLASNPNSDTAVRILRPQSQERVSSPFDIEFTVDAMPAGFQPHLLVQSAVGVWSTTGADVIGGNYLFRDVVLWNNESLCNQPFTITIILSNEAQLSQTVPSANAMYDQIEVVNICESNPTVPPPATMTFVPTVPPMMTATPTITPSSTFTPTSVPTVTATLPASSLPNLSSGLEIISHAFGDFVTSPIELYFMLDVPLVAGSHPIVVVDVANTYQAFTHAELISGTLWRVENVSLDSSTSSCDSVVHVIVTNDAIEAGEIPALPSAVNGLQDFMAVQTC